jgi:hypothetical protein
MPAPDPSRETKTIGTATAAATLVDDPPPPPPLSLDGVAFILIFELFVYYYGDYGTEGV